MNDFAKNLKEERLALSLTQQQMADILKIAQTSYSRYELGIRQPDLDLLVKIADIFDMSIDLLLGRSIKYIQ